MLNKYVQVNMSSEISTNSISKVFKKINALSLYKVIFMIFNISSYITHISKAHRNLIRLNSY